MQPTLTLLSALYHPEESSKKPIERPEALNNSCETEMLQVPVVRFTIRPPNSPEERNLGVVQKQPVTDKNAAEDEQTTNMSASCLTLKYIKTRVLLSRSQNQQSDGTKIIVSSSKSC